MRGRLCLAQTMLRVIPSQEISGLKQMNPQLSQKDFGKWMPQRRETQQANIPRLDSRWTRLERISSRLDPRCNRSLISTINVQLAHLQVPLRHRFLSSHIQEHASPSSSQLMVCQTLDAPTLLIVWTQMWLSSRIKALSKTGQQMRWGSASLKSPELRVKSKAYAKKSTS